MTLKEFDTQIALGLLPMDIVWKSGQLTIKLEGKKYNEEDQWVQEIADKIFINTIPHKTLRTILMTSGVLT